MRSGAIALTFLAVTTLATVAAAQPELPVAEKLAAEAERLRAEGKLGAAADKLREALVSSSEARYYYQLCLVLEEDGKLSQARSACRAVRHADAADDDVKAKARMATTRIENKMRGGDKPPPPSEPVVTPPPPDRPPPARPSPPLNPPTLPPAQPQPQPPPPPPGPEPVQISARGFVPGFLLGLAVTTLLSDDEMMESDPKPGFALGGYVEYLLGDRIALHFGAMITGKGANDAASDATISLTYFEFPLLARIFFGDRGRARASVTGGVAPAFNIGATASAGGLDSLDISDQTADFDLGVVVGGGYELPIGFRAITLEGRVTFGVSDLIDDSALGDSTVHNLAFSFLGGYRF